MKAVLSVFLFAFVVSVVFIVGMSALVMGYAAMWHASNPAVPAIGYADATFVTCALVLMGLPLGLSPKRS